jgi:hypothetical protein
MTVRYFDPDPVLTGWNYDYLDGSDIWYRAIWDARVFNMFADAVAERWQAMFPWESVPAICTHAAPGNYSLAKWKELYNTFVNAFYTGPTVIGKTGSNLRGTATLKFGATAASTSPCAATSPTGDRCRSIFPDGYLVDCPRWLPRTRARSRRWRRPAPTASSPGSSARRSRRRPTAPSSARSLSAWRACGRTAAIETKSA